MRRLNCCDRKCARLKPDRKRKCKTPKNNLTILRSFKDSSSKMEFQLKSFKSTCLIDLE